VIADVVLMDGWSLMSYFLAFIFLLVSYWLFIAFVCTGLLFCFCLIGHLSLLFALLVYYFASALLIIYCFCLHTIGLLFCFCPIGYLLLLFSLLVYYFATVLLVIYGFCLH
jgi:hypothetical protein